VWKHAHVHSAHRRHCQGHRSTRLRVVAVRVEHDDGVGQHVRGVGAPEDAWVGPVEVVAKGVDDAVDLLRLARQPERLQEQADRRVKAQVMEVEAGGVRVQHLAGGRGGVSAHA